MNKEILSEITILYVEDEEDVREFTARTLKSLCKKIYTANDGLEGLELFKKNPDINLIVTDINMPKMNGLQMCQKIKELNKTIPIVITSAHNDPSFLKDAINIGVSAYAMKPIDLYLLIDSITKSYEPIFLKKELEKIHIDLKSKVRKTDEKINLILDAQENLVLLLNKEKITYANKKFRDFFSFLDFDELNHESNKILDLFEKEDEYFSKDKLIHNEDWITYIKNNKNNNLIVKIKKGNEDSIFTLNIDEYEKESSLYVLSFSDISKKAQNAQLLEYRKNYDSLTNLFNRNKFLKIFQKELKRDIRYKNDLALLILDLDDFKKINEEFSFEKGDLLLIEISKILHNQLREHDILARWGGEEFIILLPQTNLRGASKVAQKIREEILNIKDYEISSSFGLCSYEENDTCDSFILKANTALDVAKLQGKNRVEVLQKKEV